MQPTHKKYPSTNHAFSVWYLVLLIGLLLGIVLFTNSSKETIIGMALSILPILFVAFLFRTFYEIKDGKIICYTLGGKNETPSLIIWIKNIKKIEVIKRQGEIKGLKVYQNEDGSNPTKIYVKNAQDFIKKLKLEKSDIRIIY